MLQCSTLFCKSYTIHPSYSNQVGWVYGSLTEDILTGQRIHAMGWRSVLMVTEPPAFMGSAPIGGPACLTQFKRWATGQSEIIISRNNPILATMFKRLKFRQCLAYLIVLGWPLRAPFELCYGLLGPYCILTNQSFLPKVIICMPLINTFLIFFKYFSIGWLESDMDELLYSWYPVGIRRWFQHPVSPIHIL